MQNADRDLPEGTYIELVRSLFSTLVPPLIMGSSFAAIGGLLVLETRDRPLSLCVALGCAAAVWRITVLLLYRGNAADEGLDAAGARALERRFALAYFSFAILFSAFAIRALMVASPEAHMLVVGLLFGYGAGVATGLSLRPWISVNCILIAIVPTIGYSAYLAGPVYWSLAMLLTVFLAGGIESMLRRYRGTARQITLRRLFSRLARHDELTGLPNLLMLTEWFAHITTMSNDGAMVAVHRLEVTQLKAVNDELGHPVGDALLKAASERLTRALRNGDFAVRTGGSQFVIVQTSAVQARGAEMLAQRAVSTISKPYSIEGKQIKVGACVGYVFSPRQGADIDHLLKSADAALLSARREASGVARHHEPSWADRTDSVA